MPDRPVALLRTVGMAHRVLKKTFIVNATLTKFEEP
jgi:hypothetical protein